MRIVWLTGAVLIVGWFASSVYAGGMNAAPAEFISVADSGPTNPAVSVPKISSRQFIVKFKSQGPQSFPACAHCLLAQQKKFQDALLDRSDSLDQLNKTCRVQKARHLFFQRHNLTTEQLRERHQAARQARVKRFTRRAARVNPQDTTDLTNVYVMETDPSSGLTIEEICRRYRQDPHVEYAHPNYFMRANFVPNDPSFGSLWGLNKIQVPTAWDLNQGGNTVVAVVDSGLDGNHLDIDANIWVNSGETGGNGIDDDNNGYIDDTRGYDFTTCGLFNLSTGDCLAPKSPDTSPLDTDGHGTHVSGIIAAEVNNGLGIAGVAPQTAIMPLQGLNGQGIGFVDELAEAFTYAANNGADIINSSIGPGERLPSVPVLEDAIRYAYNLGCVVVTAAGNENDDVQFYSPANMPETITVAATDQFDNRGSFSNYGALLDVAAPGTSILSLQPGNGYAFYTGTSMSAAHVSGLATLILSHEPNLTHIEVRQRIRNSADDLGFSGFDNSFGYGRVNAAKSLNVPQLVSLIESPTTGALIDPQSNTVNLTGTAWGQKFQQYQLFYRRVENPAWQSLANPVAVPVYQGLLGTWNFTALAPGNYLLRLLVIGTDGTDSEHVVPVTLFEKGKILGPANTSVLAFSDVIFNWSPGYGVSEYALAVATHPTQFWGPPWGDIYFQALGTSTAAGVTGIPLQGGVIFVRVSSRIGNNWYYDDRAYQMARPAQILFPTENLTIGSTSGTIYWDLGIGVTEFALGAGTSQSAVSAYPWGDVALHLNLTTNQASINNIPLNGQRLYLRLWSKVGDQWLYKDYNYQLAKPAEIIFPTTDLIINVAGGTVYWNPGLEVTEFALGVGTSQASVTPFGGGNISFQGGLTNPAANISGIPLNGQPIYMRLWSRINGQWHFRDYSYQTSGG